MLIGSLWFVGLEEEWLVCQEQLQGVFVPIELHRQVIWTHLADPVEHKKSDGLKEKLASDI